MRHLIGTLFQPQQIDKKIAPHLQWATGPDGKKRLHGAFTGGFQAGYKNTCGSKDGWKPCQFSSSLQKRQQFKHDIFTYMDKQDIGQLQAGVTLQTTQKFSNIKTKNKQKQLERELTIVARPSIGYQLIQQWNYSKYQGKTIQEIMQESIRAEKQSSIKPLRVVKSPFGIDFEGGKQFQLGTGERLYNRFKRKFQQDQIESQYQKRVKSDYIDDLTVEYCKQVVQEAQQKQTKPTQFTLQQFFVKGKQQTSQEQGVQFSSFFKTSAPGLDLSVYVKKKQSKFKTQDIEGVLNAFQNKDKQSRFQNYCRDREGKIISGCQDKSWEQLKAQHQEFSYIYQRKLQQEKQAYQYPKIKKERGRVAGTWNPSQRLRRVMGV